MMSKFLLILTLFCCTHPLFAQQQENTIEVRRGALGATQFFQNGKRLSPAQLQTILLPNENASRQFRSAKSNATLANMMGFAGGLLVGYPIGTSFGGGQPNWGLAAVGGGLIALSLPVQASFTKKAKAAVQTFNEDITSKPTVQHWQLNFKGNSMGIAYHF